MNLKCFISIIILLILLNLNKKVTPYEYDCVSSFSNYSNAGICLESVDDCIGGAVKGNCSQGFVCCVPALYGQHPEDSIITKNLFLKLSGDTPRNRELYNCFIASFEYANITNPYHAAAYFATLADESNFFKEMESSEADSDNDAVLGNHALNDGSVFRGRGAILLRGRRNYEIASKFGWVFLLLLFNFKFNIFFFVKII